MNASPWFTNPATAYLGNPMAWGQFVRWADPVVEEDLYHLHTGAWPSPSSEEWLQWTASPPNVVDLDGDGHAEVLGVPNVELHIPYVTQAYALMALTGAQGDGSLSAMRLPAFETLPRGGAPITVNGDYPPTGIPAAATVNIQGDARPEIVVSLNDGFMYAFDATGARLWRYDYTHGKAIFASEPAVADLNQDGSPESSSPPSAIPTCSTRAISSSWPPTARCSLTCPCRTPATTATATAPRPRPPWPTSTATGSSKSSSRPSTTGSTFQGAGLGKGLRPVEHLARAGPCGRGRRTWPFRGQGARVEPVSLGRRAPKPGKPGSRRIVRVERPDGSAANVGALRVPAVLEEARGDDLEPAAAREPRRSALWPGTTVRAVAWFPAVSLRRTHAGRSPPPRERRGASGTRSRPGTCERSLDVRPPRWQASSAGLACAPLGRTDWDTTSTARCTPT